MRKLLFSTLLFSLLFSIAQAREYIADKGHSTVIFSIQHMDLGHVYGRFNDVSGSISFDAKNLASSGLSITVQSASVDTHSKKRDTHLRNADFFDAGTYPTITFEGKGFSPVPGKKDTYSLKGKLTLLATTKEITVELVKLGEGIHFFAKKPAIGFEAKFSIARADYKFGKGKAAGAVGDQINLIVALEAISK